MPSVFAVGEGAGAAGAVVAADEGSVAGLAVARALGRIGAEEAEACLAPLRRRLRRLARFRAAMETAYGPPPRVLDRVTPETVLCRCEDVRRSEIDEAIGDGAHAGPAFRPDAGGNGSGQGRMCALPIAELLACTTDRRVAELGPPSIRPPIKPVAITALAAPD